jgi:homoserine dehydrogenase
MPVVEVLKFGSSVLRSSGELRIAVDEIYRRWRTHARILAVASAFEGVTDQLLNDAADLFGAASPEATAAYVATGEQRTAALLTGLLRRSGLPARLVEPREINLIAEGTILESAPTAVDATALERLWRTSSILVLPGFYGIDAKGHTALFGRGGSDLSALFLAAELRARCRLLKDVSGVFDADPAGNPQAHRFTSLSWETAIGVAGPLVQPKALRYADSRTLPFRVGRPNSQACTLVGHLENEWAATTTHATRPLRVALLGCGVVGRGVYEALQNYPLAFEIRHVVVGDLGKYPDIPERTNDRAIVLDDSIDIIVECFGGVGYAYPLIAAALDKGKFVVTANKAVLAARWADLSKYVRGPKRQLWYSAAVGGALPVLETLENLASLNGVVTDIRGIVNGTCGVVLDACAEGFTLADAIALAKAQGFAEADPTLDLSGRDSADKLALMIESAFGHWLPPESIRTRGIDTITGDPKGYKLIARARRTDHGIAASVEPESTPPDSFLGGAHGPENRIEIELDTGKVIQLRGQGAGRWPTTVSVLGDLHEIARLVEVKSTQSVPSSRSTPISQWITTL